MTTTDEITTTEAALYLLDLGWGQCQRCHRPGAVEKPLWQVVCSGLNPAMRSLVALSSSDGCLISRKVATPLALAHEKTPEGQVHPRPALCRRPRDGVAEDAVFAEVIDLRNHFPATWSSG